MTESTAGEPSIPDGPEPTAASEQAATAEPPAGGKGSPIRPKVLVWVGIAVVAVAVAVAVVLLMGRLNKTEVGECVNDTEVVSCTSPHEARIVDIVENANDCLAPGAYVMKDADGRYLCVVEEKS